MKDPVSQPFNHCGMVETNHVLAHGPLPAGWQRRTLQHHSREIHVLSAKHPADTLSLPLNAKGKVEIHLGVFRPKGVVASMQVRLSSERYWRRVEPMIFIDDPGGGLQDAVLGIREVKSGDRFLVRVQPDCCAALAYVHCADASVPAPPLPRKNVGAVIDAHFAWTKYRIDDPDDVLAIIAPFADSGFDRICWGTGAGSWRATYFSDVLPPLGEGLTEFPTRNGKVTADVMAMFQRRGIDPLKLVIDFAHEIGLELWANDRICHGFDPAETRHIHLFSDFLFKNQHMRVMTMEGEKHHQAMLSLAYPEFRELKIQFLREQARYDIDGIYIDFTRKSPVVGWEPPVLDSFKATYGKDPYALPASEWIHEWMAHQCSFVTRFMRELRAALDNVESETGRRLPIAAQVPAGWRFYRNVPECYANGLDIATWAQEGLVDIVAPSDDLWHRPIYLDHLPRLFDGTNTALWGCLHQRAEECYPSGHDADDGNVYLEAHVDPMLVLRSAADLYHQGAEGLFLWEAGDLPTVLPRWELFNSLGDREGLAAMFGPPIAGRDGRQRFEQWVLE